MVTNAVYAVNVGHNGTCEKINDFNEISLNIGLRHLWPKLIRLICDCKYIKTF